MIFFDISTTKIKQENQLNSFSEVKLIRVRVLLECIGLSLLKCFKHYGFAVTQWLFDILRSVFQS